MPARAPGWPATLTDGRVTLRPLRLRDAAAWVACVARNVDVASARGRPRRPVGPPASRRRTPSFWRCCGGYDSEARHGGGLPFAVLYDGELVGQLNIGGIVAGSLHSASPRILDRLARRRSRHHADRGGAGRPTTASGPWPASRRGQHPPGEHREPARRREARLPRRGRCGGGSCTSTATGVTTSPMRWCAKRSAAACSHAGIAAAWADSPLRPTWRHTARGACPGPCVTSVTRQ